MNGRTILIIEDDLAIRQTLQELLADLGYTVFGAAEGTEALALLRSIETPGVILLDLMMPGMNGIEFRREQLADPALAKIPVLLLSADANLQERAAALRIEHHLKKPIDLNDLLRAIEQALV